MKFILSILIVSSLFFAVAGQVQADLGTPCGDATGTPTTLTATGLTDSSKAWPVDRWKAGTVTVTVEYDDSKVLTTHKNNNIASNTAGSITVSAWTPAYPISSTVVLKAYRVTAKTDACLVTETDGTKNVFGCKQVGDQGYCGGPCRNTTPATGADSCQGKVGAPLGWAASTCTAINDTSGKPGACVELPTAEKQLPGGPATGLALLDLVDLATNWVFAIFVVLAIIFVLLAAFQFVTAGGEAEKVSEARQKLIWAAVGIVVALLAKGLVPVIKAIVGG